MAEEIKYISVISTIDKVVSTNILFVGGESAVKEAEACFLKIARDEIEGVKDYSDEDIDAMIEDGYIEQGNLCICLNHPTVHNLCG